MTQNAPPPAQSGSRPPSIVRRVHRALLWVFLGVAVALVGVALLVLLIVLDGGAEQEAAPTAQVASMTQMASMAQMVSTGVLQP